MSYQVGGAPSATLPPGHSQPPRPPKGQSNGSYGLSIRVQGIDGHPYVVLNNQDRPANPYPPSNGHRDAQGSFIDDYQDYDFRGPSPFVEYRSQKQVVAPNVGLKENEDPQTRKSPSLLNFQRHPELLKPYDPENNTLEGFRGPPAARPGSLAESEVPPQGLGSIEVPPQSATHARSSSPEQPRAPTLPQQQQQQQQQQQPSKMAAQPQAHPRPYKSKSHTPGKPQTQAQPVQTQAQPVQTQAQPPAQSQVKPKLQPQTPAQPVGSLPSTAPSPPQSKLPPATTPTKLPPSQRVPVPQAAPVSEPTPTAVMSPPSRRSPSVASSANSSLERGSGSGSVSAGSLGRAREPDVLPLRRVDSSGPVLQSSSRSRHSSTSSTATSGSAPTRTLSPGRPAQDELEALYAESINRHQNRRYIPFLPGTGRDINTEPLAGVDKLINQFDGTGTQRRGRTGRRGRIDPEDRKRSRSVDSAMPFGLPGGGDYLEEVSRNRGRVGEHVLRPSQLGLKRGSGGSGVSPSLTLPAGCRARTRDPPRGRSAPGSPEGSLPRGEASLLGFSRPSARPSGLPQEESQAQVWSKVKTSVATGSLSRPAPETTSKAKGPELEAKVTPDLLKGQQDLSQQTHDETAKQILFSYLKAGSGDNDDTTKRKVNLVFEKIQTLKSRAAGSTQPENTAPDQAAQTKALEGHRVELEKEVSDLKSRLEEEVKKQKTLLETQREAGEGLKGLQQQLDLGLQESSQLKAKLAKTESDLRTTLEELFQVKMEREQSQTEIRDLQDQLSEMHDELDGAKRAGADGADKEAMLEDLVQLKLELQEVVLVKEEQEEVLRRRERELTALKGALKEEVSTHDQEVDKLREQYEKEIHKLQASVDEAKQSNAAACRDRAEVDAARGAAEGQVGRLSQEAERLRRRVQELENEVAKLNRIIDEAKLQENRLAERLSRVEKEKRLVEESLAEVREEEEEMSRANRALTTRLEDVQRNLTRLTQEHRELEERLREERSQKEQFKSTKNQIEEERRLLDRTVEKLQREMNEIVEASQTSTQELQEQIDVYKEKNRRELADLQRQLRERTAELEQSRHTAKALQEEVTHLEGDLRDCKSERDDSVQQVKDLEHKVFDLEVEAETRGQKDDKTRQKKLLDERVAQLEMDLDEERQSGDQLMDRIDRGREQNKDLKSRVSHLEGSQKSTKEGLVTKLESRIQELEERLEGEERERGNLQQANRRLERKVKEMMMQVDDEHHTLQDQKDQLNLRLKALKRQMDEAEEEIDRLEHGKKKLQRDLDEQQEANEQLQSQLKTLRSEMRRKTNSAPLLNDLDDDDDEDDISTDGETYFSSSSNYKRSSSQDAIISTYTL
ncbi:cingulin-like protein 1 isoform X2 [Clupea harengus]|uniref:Cingulin-like protein 1 isoform X2 n=1 Tax=Clupea harengus TaxID=7950 RepID=A0A6P8GWC2_CLUHA|nr:cingulin-like protein 1 isoform X2 [Clupea harengus]